MDTLRKIRADVLSEVTDDIRILMGEEERMRWAGLRERILQIRRKIEDRTLQFRWSSNESYRVRLAVSEDLRERRYQE